MVDVSVVDGVDSVEVDVVDVSVVDGVLSDVLAVVVSVVGGAVSDGVVVSIVYNVVVSFSPLVASGGTVVVAVVWGGVSDGTVVVVAVDCGVVSVVVKSCLQPSSSIRIAIVQFSFSSGKILMPVISSVSSK